MHDLVNPSLVGDAVRKAAAHANSVLQTLDGEIFKSEEVEYIISHLKEQGLRLKPVVADTGLRIYEANKRGKKILFEGAQGTLLDVDHGTYPFVTSSNCLSAYAAVGSGVGPGLLGKVLGVMKAYSTRVGEGPFPTEMLDSKGQDLRMRGAEFGATTGRPRRTGWLDLVALKYAVRVNGITNLAITKLDILSGFGELKVCTGYNIDETYVNNFPRDFKDLQKAKPLYQAFNGFEFNAESVRSFSDLPEYAKLYLNFISSHLDTPISIVGVGPGRGQEIIVNPI
jgi:adenylosuccinate synthase